MEKEIKEKIEEVLRNRVLEVADEYRDKKFKKGIQVYLGYPEVLVDELTELFEEEKQKLIEDIKDLQIKVSSPNSEYINKLPQIQILDEVLEIIEREIKK